MHDDVPRLQWRLAMVEELIKGLDGIARAAKIRISTGRTNRPIVKLFPLELSCKVIDTLVKQEAKPDEVPEVPVEDESMSVCQEILLLRLMNAL